jgi:hypothetical protein
LVGHPEGLFGQPYHHGLIFHGSTIAAINEFHSNLLRGP